MNNATMADPQEEEDVDVMMAVDKGFECISLYLNSHEEGEGFDAMELGCLLDKCPPKMF